MERLSPERRYQRVMFTAEDMYVGFDRGTSVDRAAIVVLRREPDGTLTILEVHEGTEAEAVIAVLDRMARRL